jgi:antitoxin HicB
MSKKKKTERESLEFYLGLKYPVTFYPDPDGGYVAEIKDLPGCMTQGETADEAMSNIEEARSLWIETAYEHGDEIPLPSTETQYSGRVLLRMPRSLHQQLTDNAEKEGVSLNQYIVALLSERNAVKVVEPIKQQLDKIYSYLSSQRIDALYSKGSYSHSQQVNTSSEQDVDILVYFSRTQTSQHNRELIRKQIAAYLEKVGKRNQIDSESPSERLAFWVAKHPESRQNSLESKTLTPEEAELQQLLEFKMALEKRAEEFMSKLESDEEKVKH